MYNVQQLITKLIPSVSNLDGLWEVDAIDVPLQHRAVSISWLVVVWLLSTAITFEPTVPDIVGRIGWVDDVWLPRNKRRVTIHVITPVVAVISVKWMETKL